MRNKCAYHKTDEMKPFDGKYFYSKKNDFLVSDFLYVISSKRTGVSGRLLTPYLEGKFKVVDINLGVFALGSETFTHRVTLETIVKSSKPIDISDIQEKRGIKAFASRFLNQPKPLLNQDEVEQFNSLLQRSR